MSARRLRWSLAVAAIIVELLLFARWRLRAGAGGPLQAGCAAQARP